MTLASKLRRETTNAATYGTVTFNAPGNYARPYGRTNFTVTARAVQGGAGYYMPAVPNAPNPPVPTGTNYRPGNPNYNPYVPPEAYYNPPNDPYYNTGYEIPTGTNPPTTTPNGPCCGQGCQSGMGVCNACGYGCIPAGGSFVSGPDGCGGQWYSDWPYCPGPETSPGNTNYRYIDGNLVPGQPGNYAGIIPGYGGNYAGMNPPQPGNPNYSPGNPTPPTPAYYIPGTPSGAYSINLGGYSLTVPGTPGATGGSNNPVPGSYYTTNLTDYQVLYSANGISIPVPSNTSITIENKPI